MAAAAALVTLVIFLIPAVLELRRTLREARNLLVSTEKLLEPAILETREVLANLKTLTDATASRAEEVKTLMTALGDTGESVHKVNDLLSGALTIANKPATLWVGIKAAGKHILEQRKKRRISP
ncbi:MAG TPA: DUF948 domain-containing protein [Verrucomicrobiae bacterium]|nr:DUF948 domain-containing protein [Verrucomicrobiae bacterium]